MERKRSLPLPEWLKTSGRKVRDVARFALLEATARAPDIRRTLTVFGSRRSGTTWLLEMLMEIPGTAAIFEPFHHLSVPEAGARRIHEVDFATPGAPFEHADFVRRVLEGRVRNAFTLGRLRTQRAFYPKHFLVKFVRANRLLPWMSEAFPIPPAALIVRHPCAVVASLLRLGGGWVQGMPPSVPAYLARDPDLVEWVRSLESPEERCAAFWAIENRVALGMTHPTRVRMVCYEGLYARGVRELAPVFDAWTLPMPKGMEARFDRPSTTAQRRVHARIESGAALSAWHDELGPTRAARVLAVVRRFGFDCYSDADLPDEESLRSLVGRDRGSP